MVFFCGCCLPQIRRGRGGRGHHHPNQGPPLYREVDRTSCVLFQACWNQDWPAVVDRLDTHPHECFFITRNNRRTALHLCTMPGANCPIFILEALLDVNPHAVLVHDYHQHGGTPLHFLCGSNHRCSHEIVQLFVETALVVERQYYYNRSGNGTNCLPFNAYNGFSPLYMACRKAAPAETVQVLINSRNPPTRSSTSSSAVVASTTEGFGTWIAPWTGGETLDDRTCIFHQRVFLSPLVELWRHVRSDLDMTERKHDPLTLQRLREISIQMLQSSSSSKQPSSSSSSLSTIPILSQDDNDRSTSGNDNSMAAALHSWVKCLVLLRPSIRSPCVFLHSLAAFRCPIPALFQLACQLFPEQLLLAAPPANVVDDDNNNSDSSPSSSYGGGRIPLHLLLTRQWNCTVLEGLVRVCLETNPECCQVRDPITGLYPCCLAASQDAPLTVIYTLLQTFPLVVVMDGRKKYITTPTAMEGHEAAAAVL